MQSALISHAFEIVISVLGERTKETVIEDMKKHGVSLNDPNLTFSKLVQCLSQIIGNDATQLIAEQLIIKLDELYSKRMS